MVARNQILRRLNDLVVFAVQTPVQNRRVHGAALSLLVAEGQAVRNREGLQGAVHDDVDEVGGLVELLRIFNRSLQVLEDRLAKPAAHRKQSSRLLLDLAAQLLVQRARLVGAQGLKPRNRRNAGPLVAQNSLGGGAVHHLIVRVLGQGGVGE